MKNRILKKLYFNTDTVKGYVTSIPVYLRLPFVFVAIYLIVVLVFGVLIFLSNESFKINDRESYGLEIGESLYFSVVTITTLGYGEILPTNWWGRLVVVFETLSGVFCLGFLLTAVGFSLSNRQATIEKAAEIRNGRIKRNIGIVRLIGAMQSFLDQHDSNRAPMGMTGGVAYFFTDVGSIMYRNIQYDPYQFKEHMGISAVMHMNYSQSLDKYISRMQSLLPHHSADINDYNIVDNLDKHIESCNDSANALRSLKYNSDDPDEYFQKVVRKFGQSISEVSKQIENLLSNSEYDVEGSVLRYHPDPLAKFEDRMVPSFRKKILDYLGL